MTAILAIALWAAAWGPYPARAEDCGTLSEKIAAATSGATVDLPDGCVYREEAAIDKPLTLIGGPGVEIKGSDVWTAWEPGGAGGGAWRSESALPAFTSYAKTGDPTNSELCREGVESCGLPEQVFFDGEPLEQVASGPGPGQFAVADDRRVLLGEDPSGHEVEVATRAGWLRGRSGADGVTIEGIGFSHAANAYHDAALANGPGNDDWLIKDNEISYASAANVSLSKATGLVMEGNDVHHAGQLGIAVNDAAATLTANRVHDNNFEGFNGSWAAGGVKASSTLSLTATANDIYGNDSQGFWTDVASENVVFTDNRVHHNTEKGVHFEITDHIRATNNVIYENGWGDRDEPGELYGDAGLAVVACRDAEISENLLANNDDGITVINSLRNDGRGGTEAKFDLAEDVRVHDNRIISAGREDGNHYGLAWVKTYDGGNLDDPASGNEGYRNAFYPGPGDQGALYKWVDAYNGPSLEHFAKTAGGRGSRYLGEVETDALLREAGLPSDPRGGLAEAPRPTTAPRPASPEGTLPGLTTAREASSPCPGARVVMSGTGSGEAETPPFSAQGDSLRLTVDTEDDPPDGEPISATLVGEDGRAATTLEVEGRGRTSSVVSVGPGGFTAHIDSGEVPYRLTVEDCPAERERPTANTTQIAPEWTIPEPAAQDEAEEGPSPLEGTIPYPQQTIPEQEEDSPEPEGMAPQRTTANPQPATTTPLRTTPEVTAPDTATAPEPTPPEPTVPEGAPPEGAFPGIRWYPTMGVYAGSEKGWVHEPDIVDSQFADYVGAANEDAYLDLDDDGERYWFCGGRKITWKDALVDEDLAPADRAQARDPDWSNYEWNRPGNDVITEQLDASETIAADKSKLCIFVATTATSVKNPVPAFMLDDPDGLTWTDGQGKDHVRLDKPEAYEAMADFLIALTRQYGDDPRVASITLGEYYTNDDAGGLPQDLDEGAFAANIGQVWSQVIAAAPKDANGERINFVQSQPITRGGLLTAEDIASIGVGVSGSGAQLFGGGPVDDVRQPLRGVVPMQHQVNTGPLGQPATWDGTPNPWGFKEGQSVSTEYEHVAWYFGSKGVAPLDSLMMRDDDRYAEDWHDAYGRFGPNGSMAAQWGQIPAETPSGSEEVPGPAPVPPATSGTPSGGTCPGGRVVMSGSGSGEAETPAFSVGGPSLRLTVEPGALPEGRPISVALIGEDGDREATLEHAGEEPESSVVSAEAGRYSVEMDSGEAPYRLTVEDCQAAPEGPTGDTTSTASEPTASEPTAPEPTAPEQTLPEQTLPGLD